MAKKKINYAVYSITNTITNQVYIGIDSYFPSRKYQHFCLLKKNKHYNKHLQSSFNKYKEKSFVFKSIEKCLTVEDLKLKEIYYIEKFDTFNNGFNQTKGGEGRLGAVLSTEHKRKIGDANRGKIMNEETKKKLSLSNKGNQNSKGYKHTKEAKEKISKKGRERFLNNDHPFLGKHHTKNTKDKLSIMFSGERCPKSKLSNQNVLDIRLFILNNLKDYKSVRQILIYLTSKYNVSLSTLKHVYSGRTFKQIA